MNSGFIDQLWSLALRLFCAPCCGKSPCAIAPLRESQHETVWVRQNQFSCESIDTIYNLCILYTHIIYIYIIYIYIIYIYVYIYMCVHIPHVWSPIPLKNKQVVDSGFITDSRALKSSATRTRRSSSVQGLWLHHLVEGTHGHDVLTVRTGSLVTGDFMWLSTSVMVKAGWRGEKFFSHYI